ncbi:MAG: KamA family radical SAM protein, partial [Myxococcales bacterium]|nr:KamA family radical SAM protein [Myxococcales bacterium]
MAEGASKSERADAIPALPKISAPPEAASPAPPPAEAQDWRWQARHSLRSLEDLERALTLSEAERRGARRAASEGLPIAITPHYLSLIDRGDPRCPIRAQCVPRIEEATQVPGDRIDPLGELAHEVAPHLIRRYPDRALLLATDRCGVY